MVDVFLKEECLCSCGYQADAEPGQQRDSASVPEMSAIQESSEGGREGSQRLLVAALG